MALQAIVVGVVVIASALFAAWRLSPLRLKLRVLDSMHPDTAHVWGRWVARLRKGVAEELTHGCGACSHSSAKPPQKRSSDAAGRPTGRAGALRR
jgi:uncharacterized protein DUF6587